MSCVEVFAFDVQAGQGEALAGGFFGLFLRRADLAEAFAELDRAAVELEGRAEALYGPIRGLILHEEPASSRAASTSPTCSVCESVADIESEFTTSHLGLSDTKSCGCGTGPFWWRNTRYK